MYAYRDRHWKTRGSDRCGIQGLGDRLPDGRLITLIDLRALEYGVGPSCERVPFADVTP
jgi:hypothetical protein